MSCIFIERLVLKNVTSTTPACYSMVQSLLTLLHEWMSGWMNVKNTSDSFRFPFAVLSRNLRSTVLTVMFCICISAKSELVRPACWPSVNGLQPQSVLPHQIVAWCSPSNHPLYLWHGASSWRLPNQTPSNWFHHLTTHVQVIHLHVENKTDTPQQLHERLFDWSGLPCTAACCCRPPRSMTRQLCYYHSVV